MREQVSTREVEFGTDDAGRERPGITRGAVEVWPRSSALVLKSTMMEGANKLKNVTGPLFS